MLGSQKPYRGTPLNRTHPLARTLIASWLFNEYTGDMVSNILSPGNGVNSGGSWVAGGLEIDGSDRAYDTTPSLQNKGTIVFGFTGNSTPVNYGRFYTTAGTEFQLFRVSDNTTVRIQISGAYNSWTVPDLWDGSTRILAVTWDEDNSSAELFIDGISYGAVSLGFTWATRSATFNIGNNSDLNRSIGGTFLFFNIFNEILSDSKIKYISSQPYCMFGQPINIGALAYVASGTEVSATTDSLTLTEYAATINAATNVQAACDSLTLTENSAAVSLNVDVQAACASLTLSEQQSSISYDIGISAGVDALTLTEYSANINAEVNVNAGVANLSITEYACDVATGSGDVEVSASTDALTLTEYAASISADTNVQAVSESLTLTEHAATISYDIDIHPGLVALTLATCSATINAETNIQASTDSLSISENSAVVSLDVNVECGADALTLSEYSATIDASINVLAQRYSMVLTTHDASVSTATLATGLISVTFTSKAPGIAFRAVKPGITFSTKN